MKKKTIIVMVIVLLVVVVIGLYGTYATSLVASNTNDTYNVTLNNSLQEITIPSGSSKAIIYHITNTNNGIVQYGVVYSGSNINVKIYDDSENSATGTFDYGENKYIKLYITNSGTSDSTATIKTVLGYENGGNLIIPSGYTLVNEVCINNLVKLITNLYTNASKTTVTNNSITYNTAPSVGLMNDRKGSSSTGANAGNIRYYGASPSNYMYFNCSNYSNQSASTCETWRIIGVFDGKVKIMRNGTIGTYSWDTSASTTNDGCGMNNWASADLMKLLNPGYSGTGGSLYYNSGSGSCYNGQNNVTTTCDFTSTGIKNDITRNLISSTLHYTGGWDTSEIYSNQVYGYERGTTVYTGRPTTWTGKIVVPYPSDYGYAADLGSCSQNLYNYSDSTCTSTNWMNNVITNNDNYAGWLLTHVSNSGARGWHVGTSGAVHSSYYSANDFEVVPTLYLSTKLGVWSGNGTSTNPYQLMLG